MCQGRAWNGDVWNGVPVRSIRTRLGSLFRGFRRPGQRSDSRVPFPHQTMPLEPFILRPSTSTSTSTKASFLSAMQTPSSQMAVVDPTLNRSSYSFAVSGTREALRRAFDVPRADNGRSLDEEPSEDETHPAASGEVEDLGLPGYEMDSLDDIGEKQRQHWLEGDGVIQFPITSSLRRRRRPAILVETPNEGRAEHPAGLYTGSRDYLAPSELPTVHIRAYAHSISATSLDVFGSYLTLYGDLCAARTDTDLECVHARLEREWQLSATILLAVVAVDATVFGFSASGTLFATNVVARHCMASSAIAAALGLILVACLLFSYLGADAQKFQLALGVYSNYFFFALTSRLPLFAVVVSLIGLSTFLLATVFLAWPKAVMIASLLGAILVGLQYIAKAVELVVRVLITTARVIVDLLGFFVRKARSAVNSQLHTVSVPTLELQEAER
ncbi:hypothetical protein PENSPDRAFT_294054 [Peniophora sp. CONT]|nr:hypothetical protein PENSPDRAFT_294054 [Peniophora sp. CONT]